MFFHFRALRDCGGVCALKNISGVITGTECGTWLELCAVLLLLAFALAAFFFTLAPPLGGGGGSEDSLVDPLRLVLPLDALS